MRDATELTELEAGLVNRLVQAYPAGLGYTPDNDPPMRELAARLIEEGRVERGELHEGAYYRLTDEHAEEIRRSAAEKADGADWN